MPNYATLQFTDESGNVVTGRAGAMYRPIGYEAGTGYIEFTADNLAWVEVKNFTPPTPGFYETLLLSVTPGGAGLKVQAFEKKGTLVFEIGSTRVELKNIYISERGFKAVEKDGKTGVPIVFRFELSDERFQWRYGVVSGDYNITVDTGGVKVGNKRFDAFSLKPNSQKKAAVYTTSPTNVMHSNGNTEGEIPYTLFELAQLAVGSLPHPEGKSYLKINPLGFNEANISFPNELKNIIPLNVSWGAGTTAKDALRELLDPYGVFPALRESGKIDIVKPYAPGPTFIPSEHNIISDLHGTEYDFKAAGYCVASTEHTIKEKSVAEWEPVIQWPGWGSTYAPGEYIHLEDALDKFNVDIGDVRAAILQTMRGADSDPFAAIIPDGGAKETIKRILTGQAYKWFRMLDKSDLPMRSHRLNFRDTSEQLPVRVFASMFEPKEEKDTKKGLWLNRVIDDVSPKQFNFDLDNGIIKFNQVVGLAVPDPEKIINAEKKAQATASKAAIKSFKGKVAGILEDEIATRTASLKYYNAQGFTGDPIDLTKKSVGITELRAAVDVYGISLDTLRGLEGLTLADVGAINKVFQDLAGDELRISQAIEKQLENAKALAGERDSANATLAKDESIVNLEICDLDDPVIVATYAYESRGYFSLTIGPQSIQKLINVSGEKWILYDGVEGTNAVELRNDALDIILAETQGRSEYETVDYVFEGAVNVPSSGEYPQIEWTCNQGIIETSASQNNYYEGMNNKPAPIEHIRKENANYGNWNMRGWRTSAKIPGDSGGP